MMGMGILCGLLVVICFFLLVFGVPILAQKYFNAKEEKKEAAERRRKREMHHTAEELEEIGFTKEAALRQRQKLDREEWVKSHRSEEENTKIEIESKYDIAIEKKGQYMRTARVAVEKMFPEYYNALWQRESCGKNIYYAKQTLMELEMKQHFKSSEALQRNEARLKECRKTKEEEIKRSVELDKKIKELTTSKFLEYKEKLAVIAKEYEALEQEKYQVIADLAIHKAKIKEGSLEGDSDDGIREARELREKALALDKLDEEMKSPVHDSKFEAELFEAGKAAQGEQLQKEETLLLNPPSICPTDPTAWTAGYLESKETKMLRKREAEKLLARLK